MKKWFCVILLGFSILLCGFGMNEYKDSKKDIYFNEGDLFGLTDNYTVEQYEEYLERDIGNFVIFYKYGEYVYSKSSSPSITNYYYLAYDKVEENVYIVTKNNGCFQFTPLLNKDYIVEYDYYINHMKNK